MAEILSMVAVFVQLMLHSSNKKYPDVIQVLGYLAPSAD